VGVRGVAIALAAVVALAGCGEGTTDTGPIRRPATLADLAGPWQAAPFLLDPGLRERVIQACRREIEMRPGGVAAVVDARGGRVATVRMTGASAGACSALEITASGDIVGAGGGWSGGAEVLRAAGDSELVVVETATVEGGNLTGQGWSVTGRIGRNIVSVVAETADRTVVQATVENGWFSVWWPVRLPVQDGFAPPPVVPFTVRAYDASAQVVAEVAR
jgi:hypothetical protein